jgi:multidrug resistance efflux pump
VLSAEVAPPRTDPVDHSRATADNQIVGQAQAAVQGAQAALDQAKLNLNYTHIVAPATRVVGDKTVQVGQRLQPGEQLLSLVPLNDIWITADFRETQLRNMRRGQPVTVHVDTTGRDYKGYVEGLPGATGELTVCCLRKTRPAITSRLCSDCRLGSPLPGRGSGPWVAPGMSVEPTVWVTGHPRTLW